MASSHIPPPYREASMPVPPDPPPARTKTPSIPGMASTFDRLVDSNLQLVKTLRVAIVILVALAGYSAWTQRAGQSDMQIMLTNVLRQCGGPR